MHCYFNSRLCMRGNRIRFAIRLPQAPFQFTPLHERQPEIECLLTREDGNFNSRLCMRGNGFLPRFHYRWKISIHASAWEATLVYILDSTDWIFQFTPLHERQLLCHVDWDFIIISIHASAWEATFFTIISAVLTVFQFTPLHERQHLFGTHKQLGVLFQFTPLHERQLKTELEGGVKEYFNSRLCMRGNWRFYHYP